MDNKDDNILSTDHLHNFVFDKTKIEQIFIYYTLNTYRIQCRPEFDIT